MPATMTRGAVTLTPALVPSARLERAGRSVVHEILNDPVPDITGRPAASAGGDVQLIFDTAAAALAAVDALSVIGGPWTIAGTVDLNGTWSVIGGIGHEPSGEGMRSRIVTVTVRRAS